MYKIYKEKFDAYKILFLFLTIFLFISLIQFNTYKSITIDANAQLRATHIHLAAGINFLIGNGNNITNPYGIFQKLPALIFSLIETFIRNPFIIFDPIRIVDEYQNYYYDFSHLFSVIYGLINCFLIFDICKSLGFRKYWLGPLILISSPVFFGHSIFNIKDTPLALFYTFVSWSLFKMFSYSRQGFISNKYIFISSLLIGLTASLKLVIYPILVFTAISSILIIHYNQNNKSIKSIKIIKIILKIILLSSFFLLISMPSSWGHPIDFFLDSFNNFKNHRWSSCNFFNGSCIGSKSLNWSLFRYLVNWFSLKMSALNFFGFITSLLIFFKTLWNIKKNKFVSRLDFVRILFIQQLLIIPLLAIFANSNAYNGVRHFLFVIPSLSYFAADSIQIIENQIRSRLFLRLLNTLVIIIISINIVDIVSLSPYQYVYFNEIFRDKMINNTEIDYYQSSIGELYKKSRSKTDLFPNKQKNLKVFLKKNKINSFEEKDGKIIKLHYLLKDLVHIDDSCILIDSVERKYPLSNTKVTLSSLFLCEKSD
tara:strand:+ start:1203 stop:2822 length:1620 start_codon:yes stop_codon:yes gene_type:complete